MKYFKLLSLGILLLIFVILIYAQSDPVNNPPVANAGVNRNVLVGEVATLFGSGTDADGDPLTYKWLLWNKPGGSTSTLSEEDVQNPTFTPDITGDYSFSLRTNDGVDSPLVNVVITALNKDPDHTDNNKPIAVAGPTREVTVGEESILAGYGTDIDRDKLIYMWMLESVSSPTDPTKQIESNVQFSSMSVQSLPFTPDVAGVYKFKLVVNDGVQDSDINGVTITASASGTNRAPTADAGLDKTVKTGDEVTLSGTGLDPDKDSLAFIWTVDFKESDTIKLSNNYISDMRFTPDVDGRYAFKLIVRDGKLDSVFDIVTYTAADPLDNNKPTSNAGSDIGDAKTGEKVDLQGVGFDSDDADKDKLDFRWSIVERPATSGASLSNPNEQNPFFVPDVAGSYTFQLITNDGKEDSLPDKVNVKTIKAADEPGQCTQDKCDVEKGKWCNEGEFILAGYCDQCASEDSTCTTCKPNSCDRSNKRWCDSDRTWSVNDATDYCDKCGNVDSSCSICTGNVCDTVEKKWCEGIEWKSGTTSEYCTQCGQKDNTCPICEPDSCDTDNQNWCENGVWTKLGNYCDKCGDVDESCGQECVEGTCDTTNRRFCENNVWEEANYCLECGGVDSSCSVECTKNACDTKNQKYCKFVDKKGEWTEDGYCDDDICGAKDRSCSLPCAYSFTNPVCDTTYNGVCSLAFWVKDRIAYCGKCEDSQCPKTCTSNACDIEAGEWCDNGDWKKAGYCDKCGNVDSSCSSTCVENTCDITGNEICFNGKWTEEGYCDNCGLKDSDCTLFCAEGDCDTSSKKVCTNGVWTKESYSTLCVVQAAAPSKESCNDDGNCTIGSYCTDDSECTSEFCYSDKCTEPTCDDDARNGNETDIDCGGERCDRCNIGETCKINLDCSSNLCESRKCKRINLCGDGIKSGGETDIDCGGACRSKCKINRDCNIDQDCEFGLVCDSQICSERKPGSGVIPIDERERMVADTLGRIGEDALGIPYEERDSDNDGIPDIWEEQNGLDPNDPSDSSDDYDQDGLINIQEFTYGTNPNKADTDGDGVSDKEEIDKGTDPLELEDKPKGSFGTLILVMVLLIIIGLGGYGVFYFVSRRVSQKGAAINEQEPGFMPSYTPQKQALRKPLGKTRVEEIVEKRRMEKEEKREKLLEAFGKKSPKPKEEKRLISMAKERQEIEKFMPGKTKEDAFSKLKLISKKEKEEKK